MPPAADATADAGEAKPVPGMAAEGGGPAADSNEVSLAPDAPAAAAGEEAAVATTAAADAAGDGDAAIAKTTKPPEQGSEPGPAPARGNFIPQDALPEAPGGESPAMSVGALDPVEEKKEQEAEQNISSAAGPGATANMPGTETGAATPPAVGAPVADIAGGDAAPSPNPDAEDGEDKASLPPLMREHLAEEQQPPARGPEEPPAGGSQGNLEGAPVETAAGKAQAPAAAAAQQVGEELGSVEGDKNPSGFAGFLARLGWKGGV